MFGVKNHEKTRSGYKKRFRCRAKSVRCIRGRSQYSETSLRNIAAKTSQWNAIAKSHGETPRRDSTMKHHGGAHREALQQNVTAKYIGEALRRKAASKADRKTTPSRGREILPSGAAACEINEKGETPLLFRLDFRVFPVICFWFRSAGTETTGLFSRICKLSVHRKPRIFFPGFRTERRGSRVFRSRCAFAIPRIIRG